MRNTVFKLLGLAFLASKMPSIMRVIFGDPREIADFMYTQNIQRKYWPVYVLSGRHEVDVTLAIADTAIATDHAYLDRVAISIWDCSLNAVTCVVKPRPAVSLNYHNAHGTAVASIAKLYSGVPVAGIESFILDSILPTSVYNSFQNALLAIAQNVAQKEAIFRSTGQKYAYLVNLSMAISLSVADYAKLKQEAQHIYEKQLLLDKCEKLWNTITDLHAKYPRLQLVIAAGNEATDDIFFLANHPDVIAVASHDTYYRHSRFSNFGPNVLLSMLGEDVEAASSSNNLAKTSVSGTSAVAPKAIGISSVLMRIIPDLTNKELKKILRELSIESHSLQAPALIFTLNNVCRVIANEYKSRINPKVLSAMIDLKPEACSGKKIDRPALNDWPQWEPMLPLFTKKRYTKELKMINEMMAKSQKMFDDMPEEKRKEMEEFTKRIAKRGYDL